MYRSLLLPCFLLLCLLLSSCGNSRRPDRYLIPDGYVGWVRIQYSVAGASPLPTEQGYDLYRIPPNGFLQTSSAMENGLAKDEYYYLSGTTRKLLDSKGGWGSSMMIWGGVLSGIPVKTQGDTTIASGKPTVYSFFVGTEQQFKKWGWSGPTTIGPIKNAQSK